MQTLPPAGLWSVTYRPPLPDPIDVLVTLSTPKPARAKPARAKSAAMASGAAIGTPSTPAPKAPQHAAFGGYSEPVVWFGPPPFPSSADRISKALWFPHRYEIPIWIGSVAGVRVFTYNTGLSVVKSPDKRLANGLLNQFLGALDRSGVASYSIPSYEMIEISSVDDEGAIGGSNSVVTSRNRLKGLDALSSRSGTSYHLPVERRAALVEGRRADLRVGASDRRARALQCEDAVSSRALHRGVRDRLEPGGNRSSAGSSFRSSRPRAGPIRRSRVWNGIGMQANRSIC